MCGVWGGGLQEVAVKNMPLFLRYLTDRMHERVQGSQILWYDSVMEDGKLLWQNQLNQSNRWGDCLYYRGTQKNPTVSYSTL